MDGSVSARGRFPKGYRGEAARKHTRDSILAARRSRVHVLGVGLGDALSLEELSTIYGPEAVHVAALAQLPARLGQVVTRVLS